MAVIATAKQHIGPCHNYLPPSSYLLFPNPFIIFHESLSSLEVAQLLLNKVVPRVSEQHSWMFPLRDIRLLLVWWEHSQSRHGQESHREHGSLAHRAPAISPFSVKERAQCPRGSDVDCSAQGHVSSPLSPEACLLHTLELHVNHLHRLHIKKAD